MSRIPAFINYFAVVICILSARSYAQEHSILFTREVMKANFVSRVVEYNAEDSLEFFRRYPTGYYSMYDSEGRITQSNHYSPYDDGEVWHNNMFVNHYLYDSLGRQIAFVQIHEEQEKPIRYLSLELYDTDSVRHINLKGFHEQNSEFQMRKLPIKDRLSYWSDTTWLSKKHYRLVALKDSTVTQDVYTNPDGSRDSVVFLFTGDGQRGKHRAESIQTFFYYSTGELKCVKEREYKYYSVTKELYSREEVYYHKNGLLEKIRAAYASDTWSTRKFKYFFRDGHGSPEE